MPPIGLLLVVTFGFFVESIVGFGATVLAISLGSRFIPVPALLPAYVPVNMALSLFVVATSFRHIDRALLLRGILPLVGLGTLMGLVLTPLQGRPALLLTFAAFILVMSLVQLGRLLRDAPARPLAPVAANTALLFGGLMQGLFGAGGPLVVYVVGDRIANKSAFRATLSVTWVVLNLFLVANFARLGRITTTSLRHTAWLFLPFAVGTLLGNRLHHALPERQFRLGAYAMMLVAATLLGLGQLSSLTERP